MNNQEEKKLKEVIWDVLGVEEHEIKDESQFYADLGADELDMIELLMAVEEEFDIELDIEMEVHNLTFLGLKQKIAEALAA